MSRTDDPRNDVLGYALRSITPVPTLVLNADVDAANVLNAAGFADATHVSPYRDVCNALDCEPSVDEAVDKFPLVIVRGTRQREETLGLIATAFTHVAADGHVLIVQANALGAEGLGKTLRKVTGHDIDATSKHHARAFLLPAATLSVDTIQDWLAQAAPKPIKSTPYRGQAGLFGFDKIDVGTELLLHAIPEDARGVAGDIGCGPGLLSMRLLALPDVETVHAVDNDWRAVDLTYDNGQHDEKLTTYWADARGDIDDLPELDLCLINPPFHNADGEDKALGRAIVENAKRYVKKGGHVYLVANAHLAYEDLLKGAQVVVAENGFKVLHWVKR